MNVASQYVSVCILNPLDISSIARWNVTRSFFWQVGGGLYISGTATLTNTNVYENQAADDVWSPFELSLSSYPAPLWRLTSLSRSQGGGVYVYGGYDYGGRVYVYGGVANFEGCNVHDNTADYVCLHLKLSLNFHPSPRWNVTRVIMVGRMAGDSSSKVRRR